MEHPWDRFRQRQRLQRHLIGQERLFRARRWRNVCLWLPRKLFRAASRSVQYCSTGDCCDDSTECCAECMDKCSECCQSLPKNIWDCVRSAQCWAASAFVAFSALVWYLLFLIAQLLRKPGGIPTFPSCASRVDSAQTVLFQSEIYVEQQGYTGLLRNITTNATLCGTGFQGNSDVYGLGIRIGIYLQWASSLIANQTMMDARGGLARANLLFLLAIWIAVMVMTFRDPCDFSVEIIIMYYMFFGSCFCVFLWPNINTKKSQVKWTGPTLTRVMLMMLYLVMLCHASWFWTRGYDVGFARSPCGTHQFAFGKIDDSYFIAIRVFLAGMVICGAVEIAIILPAFTMVFAEDFGRSIKESDIYRGLFPKSGYAALPATEAPTAKNTNRLVAALSRWRSKVRGRYYDRVTRSLGLFREPVILSKSQRRSQQLLVGIIGCVSFLWSVLAIELIIKWNKISGVYAVDSTGQYIPLVMGIGGFIQLLYGFLKIVMRPNDEDTDTESPGEHSDDGDELQDIEVAETMDEDGIENATETEQEDELDLGEFPLVET